MRTDLVPTHCRCASVADVPRLQKSRGIADLSRNATMKDYNSSEAFIAERDHRSTLLMLDFYGKEANVLTWQASRDRIADMAR